jgi:SAM-dependent methyltransferase
VGQFKSQYDDLWERLSGDERAHEKAVGGDFEAMGILEFQILRLFGLREESSVVDVGCGSGRLAVQLSRWLKGSYLGTDIMPELLDHARVLCRRVDWRFMATHGVDIPAADSSADIVCFFSVLTHITHEESWQYIQEAHRVLRPGGKLICSFLEFHIYSHWAIFDATFRDKSVNKILNQFLSRDAFQTFAHHAGFRIEAFLDGDKPNIPIENDLVFENGIRVSKMAGLGQSVCVMEKLAAAPQQ